MENAVPWDIAPNTLTTRTEVADRFGGSRQGGIQPSRSTPNLFIYSDPAAGVQHGYRFDGWGEDGAYYYSGEGQTGDQQLVRGNKAIADSAENGVTLRVFEAASGKQTGGKLQRYLGAFHIDPIQPWRYESLVGDDGVVRKIIVFRLLPEDAVPEERTVTAVSAPMEPSTRIVAPESNVVEQFEVKAREAGVASRVEAELMADWESHLRGLGHEVGRVEIRLPVDKVRLLTDTFDATEGELYELKPSVSRNAVRLAVGQLLDYSRHVQPKRASVLLPERPSPDLVDLVASVGLGLVHRDPEAPDGWTRVLPPA